jgi:hypothetical protein
MTDVRVVELPDVTVLVVIVKVSVANVDVVSVVV